MLFIAQKACVRDNHRHVYLKTCFEHLQLQHLQLQNSHGELYWKEVCSYPKQKEEDGIKCLKSRNQFALAPL